MDTNSSFNLRTARTARGLSVEALALELGVSKCSVEKWQRGFLPKGTNRRKLEVFFGVVLPTPEASGDSPLKIARAAKHLSARELADQIGVSPPVLYSWEHGRRVPSEEQQQRLEVILGVALPFTRTTVEDDGSFAPERIREARNKLGISQAVLAERLGVSVDTIKQWEAGRTRPNPKRRDALNSILHLAPGRKFVAEAQEQKQAVNASGFATRFNEVAFALKMDDQHIAFHSLLPVTVVRAIRDGRQPPTLPELRALIRVLASRTDDYLLDLIDASGYSDEDAHAAA